MSAFSLDKENELRRQEDYFFVDLEIEYGLSLCKSYIKYGIEESFYLHLQKRFEFLKEALEIFHPGFVSTHIIIGLEEKENQVIEIIDKLYNLGIIVSLFAFTPIKGTKFENLQQPEILNFRKLQLGRFLIFNNEKNSKDFTFNRKGEIINININKRELSMIINDTNAFLTSGCPGCNRPFYTSKPSGPIYNYPRRLTEKEKMEIYDLLYNFVN